MYIIGGLQGTNKWRKIEIEMAERLFSLDSLRSSLTPDRLAADGEI
jgi:hypothetical protein